MNEKFESLNAIEGNDSGGDQEKTIECKTLEEYEMKKKAYLDAIFLQTLDVNHIMKNTALPAHRSQIKPERLKVLDKRINDGTYKLNKNKAKYNIYSANFMKNEIQSLMKHSDNIIQIPNTGLYLINEMKIEGLYGLLLSENVGARFLENISISTDRLNTKERNYVALSLVVNSIDQPLIIYDEPVRPFPS